MAKHTPAETIRIVGDKVAVELIEEKDITSGGLHLPSDRPISTIRHAAIRFIGDNLSENLNIGDTVVISICDSSPKFKFNDRELRLFNCKDILAVLR